MSVEDRSVDIAWLQKHPRQDEFFSSATIAELDQLQADLAKRGQQEPVHCTADGTIIRGHRRVECATRLGWKTIKAVVHSDLKDALAPEVINDLILDNVMRRLPDDLALARCYRALKSTYFSSGEGDARDALAARLNCGKSGRTLDRLERLLCLPRGVQDAISRGELTKSHGEKILRLPPDAQAAIERRIAAGEPPRQILQGFARNATSTRAAADVGQDLLKFLSANLDNLTQNVEQLDLLEVRGNDTATLLHEAARLFSQWRDRKRALQNQPAPTSNLSASFPNVGFRTPANLAGNNDG